MTTSTLPSVATTGSTGILGGHVARMLSDAGVAQRLLVRDPSRAPQLPASTVLPFAYSDREASLRALDGVETLFMVSAAENADRLDEHRAFIDAAREAGVGRIVYTSFFGAAPDATFTLARDHFHTEEYLKRSGMRWTFLRDNLYLDFMDAMVGDDGVICGPAGDGRAAIVARLDVARVAAAIIVDPERHADVTYELTGPEALTMSEVAAILTAQRGTPVLFHDETLEEAYESRRKWDAPQWQYDAWVSTYTAIAAGELERVTGDVERVTGTAPLTLAEFLAR